MCKCNGCELPLTVEEIVQWQAEAKVPDSEPEG
jgi:hypothetical protein